MKMSDALRGAAETAPVTDVHVSTSAVRSRARRARALRSGANGLAGVGAAALVFAGVMGAIANQTSLGAAEDTSGLVGAADARDTDAGSANDAAVAPGFDGNERATVACGSSLDLSQFPASNVTSSATLDGKDAPIVAVNLTYSSTTTDAVQLGMPTHYILWHDIVVTAAEGNAGPTAWDPASATTIDVASEVKLNNCWDAADLPAGDYTVVTVTPIIAAVAPITEPTPAPSGPAVEPGTVTDDPDAAVSSDATNVVDGGPVTYAITDAVPYTVPGEPVDNPFDEYLKVVDPAPLPTTPAGPSDALTSDAARAAYDAALTNDRWDMAKGTQRVVMTSASEDTTGAMWASSYYGCPSDGTSGVFPKESADLDWMTVNASLPSSVHVSYGWVVDGNPVVSYSVKNTSDWSLPGFYPGSAPRLVLVKDGRVAAEIYPVSTDQSGSGIAYATEGGAASRGATDSLIWAPPSDGYLAPGESQSGDYLWRDLNGCWSNDGQAPVAPGTYTVLSAQDLYLGGQYAVMEDSAGGDAASDSGSDKPISAPAPDAAADYVSFQVWTSLGKVTVQN